MKRPWAFICAATTTKSETLRRYCRALYELGYVSSTKQVMRHSQTTLIFSLF